ncbi:MAG: hypothetical protein AB1772_00680 [Candidatus Zixiibacteriota bacterium]
MFKPIEKGTYWRSILNMYRSVPEYSVEILRQVVDQHPKDGSNNLIIPVASGDRIEPLLAINKELVFAQTVSSIYSDYKDDLQRFHKIVLRDIRKHPEDYEIIGASTPGEAKLVRASIGCCDRSVADGRNSDQTVRDFWYCAGFCHWISEPMRRIAALLGVTMKEENRKRIATGFSAFLWVPLVEKSLDWACETLGEKPSTRRKKLEQIKCANNLAQLTLRALPLGELEMLRKLAIKTWTLGEQRLPLTPPEILTISKYVHSLRNAVDIEEILSSRQDPFSARERRFIGRLTYGDFCGETYIEVATSVQPIEMVVAAAYFDFWDELIYYNQVESYKGSFQCAECRAFIPRSFDAYGQKYCSIQCKKRANKRQNRQNRLRLARSLK